LRRIEPIGIAGLFSPLTADRSRRYRAISHPECAHFAIARRRAAEAGALPGSIVTLETEDIPIAYLPGDARRVRVRVVGDIAFGGTTKAA